MLQNRLRFPLGFFFLSQISCFASSLTSYASIGGTSSLPGAIPEAARIYTQATEQTLAERLFCTQSLAAHPYFASLGAESNLTDQNLAKGVAAFLNLLDALLEEAGKSKTDSLENQLRLLNDITQSATPIKNLKILSTEQSHLLNFLRNGDTLGKLASNISPEQWQQIQHFANEKRNELLRITEQHEAKAVEAEPDFTDIPDIDGQVRLHHLLKTRQYEKAIALLNHPKTTTRYINTRDNNGHTPLDFFEYPDLGVVTTKGSTSIEGLARTSMPSEGQAALKVAEILFEKSAMTGQQLHLFELGFLENPFELGFLEDPLPKSIEEINHGNLSKNAQRDQTQDNLTRYFEAGGNLNAVSGDGESLASLFVKAGRLDRLKKLKSLGGNFDFRDLNGETLVHQAAQFGNWQLIPFLVENGVDINAVDDFGKSAIFKLNHFSNGNKLETARMLADLRINPDIPDHDGWPAAHHFSTSSPVALQALASIGANLEIQNGDGNTPLMLALNELIVHLTGLQTQQLILTIFAEYFISKGIDPESRGLYKSKSNPPIYSREEFK